MFIGNSRFAGCLTKSLQNREEVKLMFDRKIILKILDSIKSILLLLILLKLEFKKDTDSYFDDMN